MRLLYVSQWFPPEPPRVPPAVAQAMAARGAKVSVVTGTPNFPSGRVKEGWSPRRYKQSQHGEAQVLHCPLFPSHDRSAFRRALNYLSFAVTASTGVLAWREARRVEVTLVYGSPATAALPAMILRAVCGTPYVLLIQDLWPDSITATGFFKKGIARSVAVPVLHRVVEATYRWASSIAVISPGMEQELQRRGVPEQRLTVVYNWIGGDGPALEPIPGGKSLEILYGGNLGRAQGLDVAIRAISLIDDPDVRLHLVGDGVESERLQSLAKEIAPGRVCFTPRLPFDQFQELARRSSALLISLKSDPLFEMTLPGKVPASLATGLPVLASAGTDVRELIDAADAGWTSVPGDPTALAESILALRDAGEEERARRGRCGRIFYDSILSEEANGDRLMGLLRDAVRGTSRRK